MLPLDIFDGVNSDNESLSWVERWNDRSKASCRMRDG